MSAHTPGPWAVWEGPDYVGGGSDLCIGAGETWLGNMNHRNSRCQKEQGDAYHAHLQSDDCDICSTGGEEITEEQRANARLIAAAPELLEALKDAVAVMVEAGQEMLEVGLIATPNMLNDSVDVARHAITATEETK